ncbi:MAG: 50S ribosomal protein L13, partial [Microgenomates group bacterium]
MKKITEQTKPVKASQIIRCWYEIDVKNKVLGRIAGKIAQLLQGKHKTNYVPYLDCGDYVVATNAQAVKLTGKKAENKIYTRYSGYPGGLK